MTMYEKIKEMYQRGRLWSKEWVRNAVVKKAITAEEYEVITGEEY